VTGIKNVKKRFLHLWGRGIEKATFGVQSSNISETWQEKKTKVTTEDK